VLVGGRINGRKERERGHMGVNKIDGWDGWISGPDADREYAVDPVGVDKINPSAYYKLGHSGEGTIASVRNTPSMKMFSIVRCGDLPLCRITSFIAWIIGSCVFVKSWEWRFSLFSISFGLHKEEVD
jgi:hypothetical protein